MSIVADIEVSREISYHNSIKLYDTACTTRYGSIVSVEHGKCASIVSAAAEHGKCASIVSAELGKCASIVSDELEKGRVNTWTRLKTNSVYRQKFIKTVALWWGYLVLNKFKGEYVELQAAQITARRGH